MAAVAQRNGFDHIARFAKEKTPDVFKLAGTVSNWLQYTGATQGAHPLGQAVWTVAGALEIPGTISNLHTLIKNESTPGIDPARQIVGNVATFGESCAKAVKWTLGFFKDAVTAPWTAVANGFGMYNCVDQGLRQVKDLTSECKKTRAEQNDCRITHQALDVAKFAVGFFLNVLSFAGIVAGLVIQAPVMLILSSVAIACSFAAFFFKQEANNPRV